MRLGLALMTEAAGTPGVGAGEAAVVVVEVLIGEKEGTK